MAWSGDIFQLNLSGYPDLKFQVPDEGGMLWTDNMAIPAGAAHPLEAVEWMDFVYQPRVAAMIADWVQYISPVPSAQQIIAKQLGDPTVAESPLVFPSGGENFASYPVFASDADEREWNESFSPLLGSA
jgi:spermidine/putrescine transport system substrate-binding protein